MTRIQRVAPVYKLADHKRKKKQGKEVEKKLFKPPDNIA